MIRPATEDDIAALVELVVELAAYQRAPNDVEMDAAMLREALFGTTPRACAHVAEVEGELVGMAIFYRTFSTWTGRHGIWLEDLYVRPTARRGGIGSALLGGLAALAMKEGAARLEWSVLDWNEEAITFYASLGARALGDATMHRLAGDALAAYGRD